MIYSYLTNNKQKYQLLQKSTVKQHIAGQKGIGSPGKWAIGETDDKQVLAWIGNIAN